jgi:hypothetical protein
MKGIIVEIKPLLKGEKLKVLAKIKTKEAGMIKAYFPERELAALLPKKILVGDSRQAQVELLGTIMTIIKRMSCGRTVKLWQFKENYYFCFNLWKNVRFKLS